MKKTIFYILFTVLIVCSTNVQGQWIQGASLSNGDAYDLESFNSIIYAGAYGDLYSSSNNCAIWLQRYLNRSVHSLALSNDYFFAGSGDSGVYVSTNYGSNWTKTSLNNQNIRSLAYNGTVLFAGTNENGIFVSTNNGTSWTQSSINDKEVRCIVFSGNYIFAGTYNSGIYRSSNNGLNWIQIALTERSILSMDTVGSNIFAGTDNNGVFVSSNNGSNWVQTSLNNQWVYALVHSNNYLFAGTPNGVYYSTDNGNTWTQKNEGLTMSTNVQSMLITNNYVFAGIASFHVWRRQLSEFVNVINISSKIPEYYSLHQNYPNPFNPTTKIRFDLVNSELVTIKIFDILGKEILTLINQKLKPGTYETDFHADDLPSGTYFYRLTTERYSETKKMLFMK